MTSEPTPRFTGIFIPVEILEIGDLTPTETILLSWIDALYCESRGGCYASNAYLAERLRIKENTVAKSLTKLRDMGLLENVSFDGRTRVIRSKVNDYLEKSQSKAALDKNPTLGLIKIQRGSKNTRNIHYNESKDESKDIPPSPLKGEERVSSSQKEKKKEIHGEYKNVKLTREEFTKLREALGQKGTNEWIETVDEYKERTGKRYKSDYLTILLWKKNSQGDKPNGEANQEANKDLAKKVVRKYQEKAKACYCVIEALHNEIEIRPTQGQKLPSTLKYSEKGFRNQLENMLRKWRVI